MDKINFSMFRRKIFSKVWLLRALLIIGVSAFVICLVFLGTVLVRRTQLPYLTSLARNFLVAPSGVIRESDNRTNILILGRSGEGQDSPDLTDTIILASVSAANKKITMISIPRDIWISDMKAKVNTAFYYGKQKGGTDQSGMVLAKSTIEELLNVPIHYAVVIDFTGFQKIVDEIGGIDVTVDRAFIDKQYPLPGHEADLCGGDKTLSCRYQTVEFKEGMAHMDGETALKFVRSRHAVGDEGTDEARSARQQKVIKAIFAKAVTPSVLLSPSKIKNLINIANSTVQTDLSPDEISVLGRIIFDSRKNINSISIPQEMLYSPAATSAYQNQFVYLPKKGNWSAVQAWAQSVLP